MEKEFEADFYLYGNKSFIRIRRPEWSDVEELLLKLENKAGSVRLNIFPDPGIGPSHLNVSGDNGFYLLTLLEYSNDDSDVRSYWDLSLPDKKILIHGDYWPARQLTKDFDLVVRIFKEFFETGNVSMAHLS